ncbi:MAG: hypothetical protein ABWZ63_07355 [Thermoleophilaceae bacterium]
MLRDGPFPAFLHGLVEYIAGALFIALPLLLDYNSGAATAASIIIGVGIILIAATTDWGMSLVNKIPKAAHLVLDFGLAALLIASPFLFKFSDEGTPTAIFIATGVLHVLLTIGTKFVKDDDGKATHGRGRGRRGKRGTSEELPAAPAEIQVGEQQPLSDPPGQPSAEQPAAYADPLGEQPPPPPADEQRFDRESSSGTNRITTAVSEEQQAAADAASAQTGDRSSSRRES